MTAATAEISPTHQPIAGVAPAELEETTIMTVWPSNGFFFVGRLLGQLYDLRFPDVYFLRVGHLFALASIPVALGLFFARILPALPMLGFPGGWRYRVTNRRVIVERGLQGTEEKSVDLERYDNIDIDVRPGQSWYDAGDLIFKLGNVETFRLEGVSRPDAFRSTCIKAHMGYAGVKKILAGKR
jgi:hypothetical protein